MKHRSLSWFSATVLLVVAAFFSGCATSTSHRATPPLILISMDAFRWDYCALHPDETPSLHQMMREGVSAQSLVPVFPSNTFPNHYSIVTGLYPSHHGIINNDFFEPPTGRFFHYTQPAIANDPHWWKGEPIWITAIKQGRKSACSYWVGSETEIEGLRPTYWKPFVPDTYRKTPFPARVDEVVRWLRLPADERPAVIALYIEETNSVGHKFGPDSPQLAATLKDLDGRIGLLRARLKKEKLAANLVIVSDHGMTPISPDRVIVIEDYVDPATTQIDFEGPVAGLRPLQGDAQSLVWALSALPHAHAYLTENLPAYFHIDPSNPRNPPVWIVPEEGWEISRRATFERYKPVMNKGDHGFDPSFQSMQGILIAQGPSFRSHGEVIPATENIHVYNLLCAALDLKPAPNDGDDRLAKSMLAPTPAPAGSGAK